MTAKKMKPEEKTGLALLARAELQRRGKSDREIDRDVKDRKAGSKSQGRSS